MNSTESREKTLQAWQSLVNNSPMKKELVRDVIFESWMRSRNYGINPFHTKNKILSDKELNDRILKRKDLVETAESYLENLYSFVEGSGFYVVLTDEEGYMLSLIGDPNIINEASSTTTAVLGCCRNEKAIGTNGIGLCLAINQPIQTVGEEHYLKSHHRWTCSAAPIHNEKKEIIGSINITASHTNVHPHTLGMVVAAVDGIEKEMKMRKAYNEIDIINQLLTETLESLSSSLIVINDQGTIKHINQIALNTLNISLENSLGKNINDFFNFSPYMEYLLSSNKNIDDTEITIKTGNGAYDCTLSVSIINKYPSKIDYLVITLKDMKSVRKLVHKMIGSNAKFTFQSIIGKSTKITEAIRLGNVAANITSNVLLLGESGTGKELFAQSIHNASKRKEYPFIAINCGALPRGLIESELFGYEAGAFTGAKKEGLPGKFELANGGTLFLDEIGDMPYDVQVSLLRVLQNKEVTRIGGKHSKKIDVRIIAATNKNLEECVYNKSFREDLYFRLNVFPISIPSLIERKEDIALLSEYFLKKNNLSIQKKVIGIDHEAINFLEHYSWPGNVRELENVIERALTICQGEYIKIIDLPNYIISSKIAPINSPQTFPHNQNSSIQSVEQTLIIQALKSNKGNIKKTAEELGINRRTLYNKLNKLNISYNVYRE
ncbi:MAG: sigma-54-dependent Fis family transcriptional regulator [Clostridia bacterium]|nr:sigma-54-dependent Fis family transcriptional regulator [Clostridia bacterium]